jgi:trehalose 6-phosphate phosphatase
MVGVPGLTYIGNHGLETMENEEVRLAPGAEQFLSEISRALDETEGVTRLHGVRIERKGITASIHYRQADDPDVARSAILAAISRSPTAAHLKVTEGKRVVELRPPLPINKGATVRALAAQHSLQGLLYLGDDSTDLDAFYALPSLRQGGMNALGIGLVSPENRPEFRVAIDLLLTSVEEVGQLIQWINEQVKEGDYHGRS